MYPLDPSYQEQVNELIDLVQESDELVAYLENEDEADYNALREGYESAFAELYQTVATENPLQLPALEEAYLDDRIEGLFLPKLLGFAVLRGPVNEAYQYYFPQEFFKKVLLTICASSNFDEIKKRIGQTIQMGFALSSDIWVTNLMEEVDNRQIRQFLQAQRHEKFHDVQPRKEAYQRYAMQFKDEVFFTTTFPTTLPDLQKSFPAVKSFLERRILKNLDNTTILEPVYELVNNESLIGSYEHRYLLVIFLNFFDPTKESKAQVGTRFNALRKADPNYSEAYFTILSSLHHSQFQIDAACDRRVASLIDTKIKDDIAAYYALTEIIHSKGYIHKDAIEAVALFYGQHQGLSVVNECVRLTIFQYLRKFLKNIDVADYPELFEISKVYAAYFQVFDNEHFKQDVKALNMAYLKKLLKTYLDKRGKDYQDIKRFVQTTFVDLSFLSEKEVVEIFKTRRKKSPEEA